MLSARASCILCFQVDGEDEEDGNYLCNSPNAEKAKWIRNQEKWNKRHRTRSQGQVRKEAEETSVPGNFFAGNV